MSFLNALGTAAYVTIVSAVMNNAEKIFGQTKSLIGPIAFLLLFVTSAAITGGLVLGKPVMLYLEGKKEDAVKFFICTICWLIAFTATALLLNFPR